MGTQVMCCKEDECGKHTEADLKNLVEQEVPKDYLKEMRKRKDETGWWVRESRDVGDRPINK